MTEYPYKNVIEPVGGSNGNGQTTGSYEYPDSGWYDRLKKYNGEGIAYDNIGNPLNWKVGMTNLNWTAGRQLCSLDVDSTAVSYTYTPGGTRTSKTVGGVRTEYLLDGGLIMQQKTGSKILNFYYDSAGQVVSLGYKASASSEEVFYFVSRNLQGDIVSIYKSADSSLVGTYTYDSWGKLVDPAVFPVGTTVSGGTGISLASFKGDQIGIMMMNPFRYRGYYYDNETGVYYLQSRYYDPEVKRFINADGLVSTGTGVSGHNMYAYCENNPVLRSDSNGYSWLGDLWNKAVTAVKSTFYAAPVNTVFNQAAAQNPQNAATIQRANPAKSIPVSQGGQVLSNYVLSHDIQTDVSVSAGLPGKPISVNAGVTNTLSVTKGSCATAHVGVGFGISSSPSPINASVSAGVVKNYNDVNSITGLSYNIGGSAGFLGFSQSSWFNSDVRSSMLSLSTEPLGLSGGFSYAWDTKR